MTVQTVTIDGWVPDQLANGPHQHWAQRQKKLKAAQTMAWASCKHAGLEPVTGKARLTIVLVFGVKRRRDYDGLVSRVKGLVDGIVRGGWIQDDNMEVLDLIVRAEVEPGVKATKITLEPIDG